MVKKKDIFDDLFLKGDDLLKHELQKLEKSSILTPEQMEERLYRQALEHFQAALYYQKIYQDYKSRRKKS